MQFTTPEGEVYGFVDKDGNIYLDEDVISPEHPMHEYTHLWDRAVAKHNPKSRKDRRLQFLSALLWKLKIFLYLCIPFSAESVILIDASTVFVLGRLCTSISKA